MLSQSATLFAAKVCGYALRLVVPVFLVRVFSKADFGLYSQVFLVETLLKAVFLLGVNQSLYYYVPRDPRNAGGYLLNSLAVGLGALGLGCVAAGLHRTELAAATGLAVLARFFPLLAAYAVLMMGNTVMETYLTARRQVRAAATFEILRQLLASAATLAAAFATRDLVAVVVALVAARAASLALVVAWIGWADRGFRSERWFFGVASQLRYGLVLGGAGLCWSLAMRLHQLVISRNFDVETFAVYAAGLRQIPVLPFLSQSVVAVALVQFAQLEKDGDWAGIRARWERVLGVLWGVGIPATLVLLLVARPLVVAMFTDDYADAVPVFRWNTLAALHLLLNPTLVLRAMDRNDLTLRVHAALLLAMPFALHLGLRAGGMVGVIAVHALMLVAARAAGLAVLNRVSGARLPYAPSVAAVRGFYRDAWRAGRSRLAGRPPA